MNFWNALPLLDRIRWLRYIIPLLLVPIVVVYQLVVAIRLEELYGHPIHYASEIAFYSLIGPVVTWFTLIWVERRLIEKEALEQEVRTQTQQLASLTEASADAILSLDSNGLITSWNKGAERMFGYHHNEIIRSSIRKIIRDIDELLAIGDILEHETSATTRDGQTLTVSLSLTELEGDHRFKQPVRLLIMRDITAKIERAAIIEEERARISRDLHDGVAQTLYFLALKADSSGKMVTSNPAEARSMLKDIGENARKAIKDVRRAIFGLNPLDWSQGDFNQALQQYVESFSEQMDWRHEYNVTANLNHLAGRIKPVLFRVIQESLNNIAKHARAKNVTIAILDGEPNSQLKILIQDDGSGFDLETKKKGLGLQQMQRRVEAVRGSFNISSQPGEGTRVEVLMPLSGERYG
jgi:PAS domain S-box-containing protein